MGAAHYNDFRKTDLVNTLKNHIILGHVFLRVDALCEVGDNQRLCQPISRSHSECFRYSKPPSDVITAKSFCGFTLDINTSSSVLLDVFLICVQMCVPSWGGRNYVMVLSVPINQLVVWITEGPQHIYAVSVHICLWLPHPWLSSVYQI